MKNREKSAYASSEKVYFVESREVKGLFFFEKVYFVESREVKVSVESREVNYF